MYFPKFKTFQIIIPLLKAFNISHIVISPGSRMREFVLAVEEDPFFQTYNVTDERSASYFAIGISQELNVPVVITCTSSTATSNYIPGITEAFYQSVPIIVLTGDRDPYLLGQQEDQMIDQIGMYDKIVRKSVNLPIIKDNHDKWYCERLINEALLELDHHKSGPVHINVPVPAVINWENDKSIETYPEVRKIDRIFLNSKSEKLLNEKIQQLSLSKKILVIAGQNTTKFEDQIISEFFKRYNCIIHSEFMGNITGSGIVNLASISEMIPNEIYEDFMPDLVISFHGNIAISRKLKETLRITLSTHRRRNI